MGLASRAHAIGLSSGAREHLWLALDAEGRGRDLRGLRIAVPNEMNGEGIDADVLTAVAAATETLRELGAEIVLNRMHRVARNEQNRCAEHPPGM